MKGKDSYPPADVGKTSKTITDIPVENGSDESLEANSDGDDVRKRNNSEFFRVESESKILNCNNTTADEDFSKQISEDCENDETEVDLCEQECPDDASENFEDTDEVSQEKEWDGSEAEIVVDDESEEYEDENTGIKIKYSLKPEEVREFVQNSDGYEKNKKAQKKHTIIQSIVFVLMILLGLISGNGYYMLLSLFPLLSLLLIWVIPYVGIRKLIGNVLKNQEFWVEVFPDKIDVISRGGKKEIMLDGSCESEELKNMIEIFSCGELALIIPMRAVEPEFKADLQAMIFAGTRLRYKD